MRAVRFEPFQYRPGPSIPLSQDTQNQLARKQAGDEELRRQGYYPARPPQPMHAGPNRNASFTTSVGPGRHAVVVYPSTQCTATLQVRSSPSGPALPTQTLNGAPVVYMDAPTLTDLFIRVDSPDRSCGFQFMVYDYR
jgi:hypothetical protein